jgi:hypothetical protein
MGVVFQNYDMRPWFGVYNFMETKKQTIQYWEIVGQAIKSTWNKKYLWWFGLLASLSGGSNFFLNFPSRNNQNSGQAEMDTFYQFINNYWTLIFAAITALIILFFIFFILGLIGRGALIRALEKSQRGEKMNFRQGLRDGRKYFWQILAINLTIGISLLLAIIVMAIPITFMFINKAIFVGATFTLLAFIILIPLFFLAAFLKNYGYLYLLLAKLRPWAALENAYALLLNNLPASILMLLVIILTSFVFGLVVFSVSVPVILIFMLIGGLAYLAAKIAGVIVVAVIGGLVILAAFFLLRAVYETFVQTVWILFFQEIAKPKVEEKIAEKVLEPKPTIEPDIAEGI